MKTFNWKGLALIVCALSMIVTVPVVAADDNHCGLKGTYAYTGFGHTYDGNPLGFPAGSLSVTGTITIDGNGNSWVRQTGVINGQLIGVNDEYTGTYTLNPDCTFTTTMFGIPAFVGAVADHGKQIRAIITIPGIEVNFTNTIRIHP